MPCFGAVLLAKEEIAMEKVKKTYRGELALLVIIFINSLGVVLMLRSGSGISAISSVPYAFSVVFPRLTLGQWTYLFQSVLILSLFVLRRKFVLQYLFSFVVGFVFGNVMDLHELWVEQLPQTLPLQVLYFILSYLLICVGIALSNHCKMPIVPTDLFPRELAAITGIPYSRIKVSFDVICLLVTAVLTYVFLGRISGLGIGTVLAAFTMGKVIGVFNGWIDRHMSFTSFLEKDN
jgi:uncharacterized membrane protein YczE